VSSRLFQEIRETRGLAYTTYSYASSFTDAGLARGLRRAPRPARSTRSLDVLRRELDRIPDDVTVG
jgi:predicted Zn-dependent peptidase